MNISNVLCIISAVYGNVFHGAGDKQAPKDIKFKVKEVLRYN